MVVHFLAYISHNAFTDPRHHIKATESGESQNGDYTQQGEEILIEVGRIFRTETKVDDPAQGLTDRQNRTGCDDQRDHGPQNP